MDPTMGAADGTTNNLTLAGAEDTAVEYQPSIEAVAVETPPAPAPKYPIGQIDYNKPFVVFDIYNRDDEPTHTDARVIAVLSSPAYPIVVASFDPETSEEVVNQFNLDGSDMNGDLKLENIVPDVFPRTVYVILEKGPRGVLSIDQTVYDSEASALKEVEDGETVAIVPVVLDAGSFAPRYPAQAVEVEEESDGEVEEDGDRDGEVEEDVHQQPLPEGAVLINGQAVKPGDKVRAWRSKLGYERTCTVIKMRPDPYKSLYIRADSDGSAPYWANNYSIRQIYPA